MKIFGKKSAFFEKDTALASTLISVLTIAILYFVVIQIQKIYTANRLHNIYNELSRIVTFSEVDNGPSDTWELPKSTQYKDMEPFVKQYYMPYLSESFFVKVQDLEKRYTILKDSDGIKTSPLITNYLIMKDGAIVSFFYNKKHNYILMFVDINGQSSPNKIGRDVFVFIGFNGYNYEVSTFGSFNNIGNLKYHETDKHYGCSNNMEIPFRNFYCAKVIELNDWSIPSEYPW